MDVGGEIPISDSMARTRQAEWWRVIMGESLPKKNPRDTGNEAPILGLHEPYRTQELDDLGNLIQRDTKVRCNRLLAPKALNRREDMDRGVVPRAVISGLRDKDPTQF